MNQQVLNLLRSPGGAAAVDPLAALPAVAPLQTPGPLPEPGHAPAEVQMATAADPSRRWSASTAILEVHQDGESFFQVHGAHQEIELPLTGGRRYGKPKLSLADLAKTGGEMPSDVLWLLREWSDSHNEIVEWIVNLRLHIGDDEMRLIIWDDTGFDIPWELLWIASPDDRLAAGWLGSLVPVVRWTTIRDTRSVNPNSPYTDAPAECRGEIAAYLIDEMAGDLDVLIRFGSLKRCNATSLISRLAASDPPLGLVYVASHGKEEPQTVVRQRLGDLKLKSLSLNPLPGISASRSFVFLNACHSGRLYADERLNDSLLRGFAQAFLKQGAAVVIGTTGAVGESRAQQMAREILQGLASADKPHVAVVLRDARARIASTVSADTEDQRLLLPFFHTFMYVCYGNARTTVYLVKEDQ